MITDGLEKISLEDIKELFKLNKMPISKAVPLHRAFRDKHELTEQQARNAFAIAKRIFDC